MKIRKNFLFLSLLGSLLIGCGSESTTESENELETVEFAEDTTTEVLTDVLTIKGALDEVDETFYVYVGGEIEDQEILSEVHIIPDLWTGEDSSDIMEFMQGIAGMNFSLSYQLPYYSGPVTVFYTADKTEIAAEFSVLMGKPDGEAILYEPGMMDVMVQREYEEGRLVNSMIDVYEIQWEFNQRESSLTCENLDQNTEYWGPDQIKVLKLGPSAYSERSGDNNLAKIIEKKSFEQTFFVNDQPYTGRIMAYDYFNGFPLFERWELNFKNGWLHDTIKVYNWWGELKLLEVFSFGDLDSTLYVMDESYEDGVAKPIIYLYPEEEMEVNVRLKFDGGLTHTYPKYPTQGWNVTAESDGTIHYDGREYYSLFWEGDAREEFTMDEGFVVAGDETAEFLESSLEILGLNDKEANEFIIYWLPLMENNEYNLIHFASDEYEEMAELNITPQPDAIVRVMMVWSPLTEKINIPQQNLYDLRTERSGFTVVEWGGRKQLYKPEV